VAVAATMMTATETTKGIAEAEGEIVGCNAFEDDS
jgi:hypothetical protein